MRIATWIFLLLSIIDPDPLIAGENLLNFYMDLEELMGRRIDLVDEDCLKNPYFIEELNETKQLIYG